MSDILPVIDGTIAISITDPIKNDQGMMKSYISYKVNTETSMSAFADKQFSVIRRYSDFTWLRDTLKQHLPGVIVPPLPEKAVMNNFSPEFIESRRRALERFIVRCSESGFVCTDPTFQAFLSADDEKLAQLKAEVKKTASAGSSGYFASLTGASESSLAKIRSPSDAQVDEVLAYVLNLEAQLSNVAKHTASLMKRGKELSTHLGDFGLAFTLLGKHETEALHAALSKMGHTADQLSLLTTDQVEKEQRYFEEPIGDYLAILGAVKEAIDRRNQVRKAYFTAVGDVEAKTAALAKLKQAAGVPASEAKIPGATAALATAEDLVVTQKDALSAVTGKLLGEVHRFKRSKADDMRKVVLDYVTLQIEFNKATEAQWAELVPEIESIQVEASASVDLFDGPVANASEANSAEAGNSAQASGGGGGGGSGSGAAGGGGGGAAGGGGGGAAAEGEDGPVAVDTSRIDEDDEDGAV